MAGFGGGNIGLLGRGSPKAITLNDIQGQDKFIIYDSDGFPIFTVDSKGNYGGKGVVKKP